MRVTLAELAALIQGEVVGDGQTIIRGFNPLDQAQVGDLAFVSEEKHTSQLATSHASAVLISPLMPVDRPAIRIPNPYLGFMHLLEHFFPAQHPTWGIDPRAILGADVVLGHNVNIGPYAVIDQGTRLGDDVTVYPGTYIGAACEIGAGCVLYANVSLYPHVQLGCGVIVHSGAVIGADGFGFYPLANGTYRKIPQVGRVIIGDAVEIGANTCIDRATIGDTVIETGVKLDNLVQIGHNSFVGAHTVLAGQVGVSGSVHIGAQVRIGGQVGIADHITVGERSAIAAQSGVASDVVSDTIVFGTPAVPAPLAKRAHLYSLRLRELFQHVKQLQRRLEALESREKSM